MCDCFHLAFPNWHGPATGAGRRLRGPEQYTEEDSVCEEPEILEGERPRPQGSSPVEEFPAEKQAEDNFNSSPLKGGNKKSRRVGFGSLFDKRSSAKMSETEDMQSGGAGVIVKTVKDSCAEGLVVSGGGKDGIFIKEVKPDSPAARHMTMKEGDQILSATVYFDNVSYEDALQILEHAQPYKMELCVRRKVESTLPEDEDIRQEGNEGDTPQMRSPRKKKQRDRISWPKFPSFGKGHRAQFKRSHSTSEAEEHKKLEMSPTTSDTESPFKSPLKSPDGKDKKKKQKAKMNKKMKGHSNKSIEESPRNEKELTSENLIVLEDQQFEDALQENFSETLETKLATHEAELSLSEKELQHKVLLISLSNTLKTADISDALADGSAGETRTSEEGRIERSEMKVSIHQKENSDIGKESQSQTVFGTSRTSDSSAYDSVVVSPVLISQAEPEKTLLDTEKNTEIISKDNSEMNVVSGNMEISMQQLDLSVDLSDAVELKQSPKISGEKQWKERTALENESYGIRTRGPLGDIATSKTHFASTVNGLQFTPPDSSEMTKDSIMPETITIISQPKPNDLGTVCTVDAMDSQLEIKTSKQSTETNIDTILSGVDIKSKSKFKLPNVDFSGLHEPLKMTKVGLSKTHLPKREDIEIPGMEDKEAKLQTPGMKILKTKKITNITKDRDIQVQRTDKEFNVEDVKEAVSMFPALKLPEGDITGVLVQREITIMEMKADKTNMTPRGSPRKISETSADGSTKIIESKIGQEESSASNIAAQNTVIKIPKVELPYADEETIAMTTIDYTKPKEEIQQADDVLITDGREIGDVKFKLPKREDIEIPGMEAIEESIVQNTDLKVLKDKAKKHDKTKGREKKSKKPQISMPSFGITKPDIRFPDIGIELPKKDVVSRDYREIQETKLEVDADIKLKDASVGGQKQTENTRVTIANESETLNISFPKAVASPSKQCAADISVVDIKTEDIKTEGQGKKFKLPKFEISFPEVPKISASASKKEVDNTRTDRKGEMSPKHLPEMSIQTETKSLEFKIPGIKGFKIDGIEPKVEAEIFQPEEKKEVEQKTELNKRLSNTELKEKAEPLSANIKGPDIDKSSADLSVDMKFQDIENERQASKFKLPKFGIKLPEIKAPQIDLNAAKTELEISLPDRKLQVQGPDLEVQEGVTNVKEELPEIDSKGLDVKTKRPSFSFPKFGFSKSEMKGPGADVNAPDVDVSLPEGSVELEATNADIKLSVDETGKKDETRFGSPTKFKLPSITLPKFGVKAPKGKVDISGVDVQAKGKEVSLPDAEIKLSTEPVSVCIKGPEVEKEDRSLSVDIMTQDIQTEGQRVKLKFPKLGTSLAEVKGPKLDLSTPKTEIVFSLPEGKMETHQPNITETGAIEVKEDVLEIDSKDLDVKTKQSSVALPNVGLLKSEMTHPRGDVNVPNVDVSLPEGSLELEAPKADITVSKDETEQKDETKFGSPTRFKLPSFTLPKFGVKGPKGESEVSGVEVQAKGMEVSLPDAELKLSTEPLSVDIKGPEEEKEDKSLIKTQDTQIDEQGSKRNIPKFGISIPGLKGPKIDSTASKTVIDVSLPEVVMDVHPADIDVPKGEINLKADTPEIDSKSFDVKTKQPSFSFPKIGFSKSEMKAPEADISVPDVDVSLPKGSVELEAPNADIKVSMDETRQKDETKFGSPTKFKLPSITLPIFGVKAPKGAADISGVEVQAKGKDVGLPDAELKLSAEPKSFNIKGPDLEKEALRVDMKDQDALTEEHRSKFKLPRFGISIPEVKGPEINSSAIKTDIGVSLPEGKMEVHSPDAGVPGTIEMKADVPETDSKDLQLKTKRPSLSFPKFGFSKSEIKTPEIDVSIPDADVSVPKGSVELEAPSADFTVSMDETEKLDEKKIGSATKFKLPSITLPKFGVKDPKEAAGISPVETQSNVKEVSLPEAGLKFSAEPHSVDIKGPEVEIEDKSLKVDIKTQDIHIEEQGNKTKIPKFGINLPQIKGPKIDLAASRTQIDISLPESVIDMHPPDIEVPKGEIKLEADIPEIDSKSFDVKTKQPSFSFPKFGFSKSEMKAPEADISVPDVDVSLPEGSVALEAPNADIKVSMDETGQKDETKFGSPTKFKLPSITLPKFGFKAPKGAIDVSGVEVKTKGKDLSLPDAEIELSAEPMSVDIKGTDVEKEAEILRVDVKAKDIQTEEQRSKFKFPKFGISLPDVKGPKIDSSTAKTEIDVSLPEGKMEVYPPDAEEPGTIEVKAEIPEIDSKNVNMKTKRPSFSFPKFGFSKSEMKAPETDASAPDMDVSLPEGSVELDAPNVDITVSMDGTRKTDETKFGSPTKFKLPSITLPKFGVKAPKGAVDVSGVEIQAKGKEVSLPDAEIKFSAEPLSAEIKGPELEKGDKSLSVDITTPDIQTEEQASKLKIPKFGISLPEVKGPTINLAASKTEIDVTLPVMEVHPPDAKVTEGAIRLKEDIPEKDSKSFDVKTKQPSFSFPKFGFSKPEMKAPEADVSVSDVDVSLPEGHVELEAPNADIKVSVDETRKTDEKKFGSPTKFKFPSITLPKFGVKAPKGAVDVADVEVQAKGKEVSLPDAEIKLSTEPLSVDMKETGLKKEAESLRVDMKVKDFQTEEQGNKFKIPKFGISLPEVKAPKIDFSAAKTEIDVTLPEGKMEVQLPDVGVPGAIEMKGDVPEIESKDLDTKSKRPGFSFPKFGFSRSEMKAPEADISAPDVNVSLPEGSVELEAPNADITVSMDETRKKDETKFGSPTKFKLPSFTLPKFGVKAPKVAVDVSAVEVQAKGKEESLPDAEIKFSAKPISVEIKGPELEKGDKSLSVDITTPDIQTEEQARKLNIPKFGISLPKVQGQEIDLAASRTGIDVSLPEAVMDVHPPDAEVTEGAIKLKADIPEIDSKSFDVKTKQPSLSFPKFGFSKPEMKAPESDVSVPDVDVSLPEGHVDLEAPNADITLSVDQTRKKREAKFGSPTKFKLPSFTLPKFGVKAPKGSADISDVEIQAKGKEISLPDAEVKLSTDPLSIDIKGPELEKEDKSLSIDMKAQDIQTEENSSKFKLPKFGSSFPEVKGSKLDSSTAKTGIDISIPEGNMKLHPPDVGVSEAMEAKADVLEIVSKDLDMKTKQSGFSFSKFGFSKSETRAPEVDVSLPKGSVEAPGANITVSMDGTGKSDETKFGSPTKIKLPSITLPKFGVKDSKGAVDVSGLQIQGKEISLPDTEIKMSTEPLSAEIKGPEVEKVDKSLRVDITAQDIQTEEHRGKFKFPKFGISLPDVKGPKIDSRAAKTDIDISLPGGKMEVHPPDVGAPGAPEVNVDIPEIASKDHDVKTKRPSFSFPKFGFSKSEMKAPETDVSAPDVDVPLPEGSVELEAPNADITVSMDGTRKKDETKFGSPTKFKLPSITLPKFGVKAPKGVVDVSGVEIQAKGKEVSLPDAGLNLSAEPLSVDIKGPETEKEDKSLKVDIKTQDIQTDKQRSKLKFPKFGISLPEIKGPKIDASTAKTETDVSLPEGKMEVHPPDTGVQGAIEVKADFPKIDSKDLEMTTKRPGFSFPTFGFSKSEMKVPEADISVSDVNVPLPEGSQELEAPNVDVTVSVKETGKKDESKFGSPTKFKLPSITLPKFGVKAPKGAVDMSSVEVQAKGKEVSLPDAEMKLSAEPLSVDLKGPEVEKEDTSLQMDVKAQDIQIEEQGTKLKFPKFGISLPGVKGPKIDSTVAKKEIDISVPEGKMEVHQPDFEVTKGAISLKADIPEIDSKGMDVTTKQPFPKFPEIKVPETVVNVGNADITLSIDQTELKDETKFGSPTKFKLPSITLPKFEVKTPKEAVEVSAVEVQTKGKELSLPDAELEISSKPLDLKVPSVERQEKSLSVNMKAQEVQIETEESTFKLPKFGIKIPEAKGTKMESSTVKTKIDISLPEAKMEVQPGDTEVDESVTKVKEIDSKSLDVKTKQFSFSFPKFGFSKSETKTVSLPDRSVDLEEQDKDTIGSTGQKDQTKFASPTKFKLPSVSLPKSSALEIKTFSLPKSSAQSDEVTTQSVDTESQETKHKENTAVTGSPVKFKLPTIKMPTFGNASQKTSETRAVKSVTEKDVADINVELNVGTKHLKSLNDEVELKDTILQPPEAAVTKEEGDKGSSSRFKLPTIKMSKIGISKTKSQDGDNDTSMGAKVPVVVLEAKHEDTQGHEKSSKFTVPALSDVLRGFDVEFNVPTLDEVEEAKIETSAPMKMEYEKQTMVQMDQKADTEETQAKAEKSGWFSFPKFSSPTKTAKVIEIESSQPYEKTEESPLNDNKEKEPEQPSIRETEEDSVSPTWSLRSSDAFADVSSALTTEQVGLSMASPTKVKVTFSEPTATVEIGNLHGDVITSTAKTELISMEPHQPEKVNIPGSSDMSSSSVDSQRQMSGEIHIVVSTVQTVPDTATINNIDIKDISTLHLDGVSINSDSVRSVEDTRETKKEHTLVERHVVKEMFCDDKEKVFATRKIQIFEGDSAEPISDDTASSIQKLRDTVRTEKMKFFEDEDSSKQNTIRHSMSLRHIDSSAEENGGGAYAT